MIRHLLSMLLLFLLPACNNSRAAGNANTHPEPETDDPQPVAELSLPEIPASLRQPAERAAYLLEHFWDALAFTDTLRSHNAPFLEQAFANFISVFPHADTAARRTAVRTLLQRAEEAGDLTAYTLLTETAEKYLYEPDSPLYSEEYYLLFLEQIADAPILGEYGTIRPRWQLESARKNRPGMRAADFAYTTRDDRRTSLHETPVDGTLLLIFYDPDCEHCREVMAALQQNEALNRKVAEGTLTVLAVYSGEERSLWRSTAASLPADWIVGYESGVLQEEGAYVLRSLPTLYLLDRDKRVVQKEPRPDQLFEPNA